MRISITLDSIGLKTVSEKTIRKKGKSLLEIPEKYVVIDTETTGLSPDYNSIIEISGLKVQDGIVTDEFSRLVKLNGDDEVPEYITQLTGISNDMLLAKGIDEKAAIKDFISFVGEDILVGYNVNFDINFIYDTYKRLTALPFKNDYIDVMRISRKLFPNLKHHRLRDMQKEFSLSGTQEHRSLSDCYLTKEVYDCLLDKMSKENIIFRNIHKKKVNANNIKANTFEFDESNAFFNKNVCFTGKMDNLIRKEAMQLIADLGGIPQNGVTKDTNFLIVGDTAYCANVKNGVTGKTKKANDLIIKGADLSIITESVFSDMIHDSINI